MADDGETPVRPSTDGKGSKAVARRGLSMRKIREVLRLHFDQQRSLREIAESLLIGHTTAGDVIRRAKEAGLGWPLPETLDDAELEQRLYPGNQGRPRWRPEPDWARVDAELRAHKGVTLELLWLEYKRKHPEGYQYSQFCAHFAQWRKKQDVVLRQSYRAGEKMFVDYAGPKVPVYDRRTGAVAFEASIFLAVLGASNYVFCEAHRAQDLPHWLQGHVHAFEHFHGVPRIVVPDNLKAGVREPSFYEPDLNPSYAKLAAHYGTVVIPARPRRPRDKAAVEVGVQVVERWVLAVLRHRWFFDLAELNAAIALRVQWLNERPFRKRDGSRRILFETLDRPALQPLPQTAYVFAEWKQPKVNIDYHVDARRQLLLGPIRVGRSAPRRPADGHDGRDLSQGPSRGQPSTGLRPRAARHFGQPHAEGAPALREPHAIPPD